MKKNKRSKPVVFASRYGSQRVVEQINDDQFTIEGPTHFMRAAHEIDGDGKEVITMVDFEGGPYIELGTPMSQLDVNDDRKITGIEFLPLAEHEEKYAKVLLKVS
jgi:hypothetical protein